MKRQFKKIYMIMKDPRFKLFITFLLSALLIFAVVSNLSRDNNSSKDVDLFYIGLFAAFVINILVDIITGVAMHEESVKISNDGKLREAKNILECENSSENDIDWAIDMLEQLDKDLHKESRYCLGVYYSDVNNAKHNYDKASSLLKRAAKQGLARAQYSLAEMYYHGHGVPINFIKAYMWVTIGLAVKFDEKYDKQKAEDLLENLIKIMNSVDIGKAEEMAKRCKKSGYENCG